MQGGGRISKITIVEKQMITDDETTAVQLQRLLNDNGYDISLCSVLCCRVRGVNSERRSSLRGIFIGECSFQVESYRRFCCRKRREPPRNMPRSKHPLEVHIWAGISFRCPAAVLHTSCKFWTKVIK